MSDLLSNLIPLPFTSRRLVAVLLLLASLVIVGGCSRKHYRTHADQDVAAIYAEKEAEEAYTLPPLAGIDVDPRSRFFDPSPADCPALPVPEPTLDGYQLPPLATGNPYQPRTYTDGEESSPELIPPDEYEMELVEPVQSAVENVSFTIAEMIASDDPQLATQQPGPQPQPATPQQLEPSQKRSSVDRLRQLIRAEADPSFDEIDQEELELEAEQESNSDELRIVPVPQDSWAQLPETCVTRMLEFSSLRQEFRRSYPDATADDLRALLSDAPRLTLPMITELATFNNRALQTQKESLYKAALALTGQRYEYVLRPTRRGNVLGADYTHVRLNGITENGLRLPGEVSVRKTTATAGQFLARFANRVVLTFNGPDGFAANIGTDLVFDFQQTLFQRDVVFEGLTRAERNVIYEARDLIQAQRSLFVDLANDYYTLLLTYRAIEISSQDYFSNLRAFLQGKAEYLQAGRIPRIQVDQFEQNALSSRSSLVSDCNSLETALDRLKLRIGLPPEMPLNLNLEELEALTIGDELTVTRQLVIRTRQTLLDAAETRSGGRNDAVNAANVLTNRLMDTLRVRRRIAETETTIQALLDTERLRRRLALLEARLKSDDLETKQQGQVELGQEGTPLREFPNTMELIDAKLVQARRAIELDADGEIDADAAAAIEADQFQQRFDELQGRWDAAIEQRELDELPSLVKDADDLLINANDFTDRTVSGKLPIEESELDELIVKTVAETVDLVDRVVTSEVGGLDDVVVQENEAMLLALYQRLDLMNERGRLADDRRQIKLAADDLRAILDIVATQRLSSNRSVNDVFDFSVDGSTTNLALVLDTPLNRRIERNVYRAALIDYQAGRRSLIEAEDGIKFDIREDLRQLRLRRDQYGISVARAALAYERVVSTRLQLQLALGNVVARDFLEAQQAFTSALNSVARDHIAFIRGRIQLFQDTESVRLDENGYWSAAQNESLNLPPVPDFYDANPNPYGRLPPCLHYSDEVRRNH